MNWFNNYIASPTHQWWVENVWRPSWTKVVSAVYGIPALLVSVWQAIASFANDTTIGQYMDKLHVPNWVPMAFAGVALVQYIAHGRKANEAT